MTDAFTSSIRELEQAAYTPDLLSQHFVRVLPVTGAAVSTLGDVLGSETLSATDARALLLDEVQFDLGEGPCWDALRLAQPIAEPDLPAHGRQRWPAFSSAVRGEGVMSIFAFPLAVGTLRLGAVDLYSTKAMALDPDQTQRATALADVIGRRMLREALTGAEGQTEATSGIHSRRVVHQATGVVLAQLEMSPDEAQLMIQSHAFATNRSVMDVAREITEGRLRFGRDEDGRIEVLP